MCTLHVWPIVHAFVLACLSVCECVFPLGFQGKPPWPRAPHHSVSRGMAVGWASTAGTLGPMGDNHCCFIAAKKETDRYCMDEKRERKKRHEFCLRYRFFPFFFVLLSILFHLILPSSTYKSARSFTRYQLSQDCILCVCVCLIRCVFCRESSVNTSSSPRSHDLGLLRLFFLWELRKDKLNL